MNGQRRSSFPEVSMAFSDSLAAHGGVLNAFPPGGTKVLGRLCLRSHFVCKEYAERKHNA